MMNHFVACNRDIVIETLKYLTPRETLKLGQTSVKLFTYSQNRTLWEFYFSNHAAQKSHAICNDVVLIKAMVCMRASVVELYFAIEKLNFGLLGWFRVKKYPHGGLACIRAVKTESGLILCLEIFDSKSSVVSSNVLQYNTREEKVTITSASGDVSFMECLNDLFTYTLQPFQVAIESADYPPHNLAHLKCCNGLFIAPYGSHGLELLHVMVVTDPTQDETYDPSTEWSLPYIRGLKLTGDPNVPAGKISFMARISSRVEVAAALANDERPNVVFPANGHPELANLADRRVHINACYEGAGQINQDPSNPRYEWVGLTFIVYKGPLPSNGAVFSILWDDEGQRFRHMMDFIPQRPLEASPPVSVSDDLSWDSIDISAELLERFRRRECVCVLAEALLDREQLAVDGSIAADEIPESHISVSEAAGRSCEIDGASLAEETGFVEGRADGSESAERFDKVDEASEIDDVSGANGVGGTSGPCGVGAACKGRVFTVPATWAQELYEGESRSAGDGHTVTSAAGSSTGVSAAAGSGSTEGRRCVVA